MTTTPSTSRRVRRIHLWMLDRGRGRIPVLVTWVAFFLLVASCADASDGSLERDGAEEQVRTSEQGLTCVTVQRIGSAQGGVQDAPIITDPADPTKASTNYGAVAQMNAGYVGLDYRRILVRFDLAAVPAGSTIESAIMTLRMVQSLGKASVDVHAVNAPWTEGTVTWNQIGSAFDPAVEASFSTLGVPNNSPVSVDVTNLVARWVSGEPNHGLLLDHPAAGRTVIGSSEAPTTGPRPKLQVCYAPSPCNDGVQDAGETGVDCGGSCPACPCAGVVCTALDACHVAGACDPATGICSNPQAPDGASCNDGNACTLADACHGGACAGSNPVVCTASDACHTAGSCNPAAGVCSSPQAPDGTICQDDNGCTYADACQNGICAGAPMVLGSCDAHSALAMVSGGVTIHSQSYSAVLTLSQSPGSNGVISSVNYVFHGGLVGSTQGH